MKAIRERGTVVGVELTRRNIETLLLKLDDPSSARMIVKDWFYVRAVENEAHYEAEGRPAGRMRDEEEALISRPSTGVA